MKLLKWLLIICLPALLYSNESVWKEIFHGVEYQEHIIQIPQNLEDDRVRVHIMRVSLDEEGVSLFLTPPGKREEWSAWTTKAMKPTSFIKKFSLQVAINGTGYMPVGNEKEGATKHAKGYANFKGKVYGSFSRRSDAALIVKTDGSVHILKREEVQSLDESDIEYGLGGWMHEGESALIVEEGKPLELKTKQYLYARTALGISKDQKFLYLVVVDGPPAKGFWFSDKISVGIGMKRLSILMSEIGSWRAINLDGSGSSTMVVEGVKPGSANVLNLPSDYNTGSERAVGTHLGVYAKPIQRQNPFLGTLNLEFLIDQSEKVKLYRDKLEAEGLSDFKQYLDKTLIADPSEIQAMVDIVTGTEYISIEDELKSVGNKSYGASTGGVYRDANGVVWFVKKGQHPEYEYLASMLMQILYGELAPRVKLVDGKKRLTASRQVRGFIQKSKAPKEIDRFGEGALAVGLDWLGVVDRHGQNMGYVRSSRGLEAARVDYDHSFSFAEKYKIRDTKRYAFEIDEAYILERLKDYELNELVDMLKSIEDLPDDYISYRFKKALDELQKNNFEVNIVKLENILLMLLDRKKQLARLLELVLSDEKYERISNSLHGENMDVELLSESYSQAFIEELFLEELKKNNTKYEKITKLSKKIDIKGSNISYKLFKALEIAIIENSSEGVLTIINLLDDSYSTFTLKRASKLGKKDIVALVLKTSKIEDKETLTSALRTSLLNSNVEVAQILINAGANPNHLKGEFLNEAAKNGQEDIVNLLIEKEVNSSDALISVAGVNRADERHLRIVKLLLEKRSYSIDIKSTALIEAINYQNDEIAYLLLQSGADASAENSEALGYAVISDDAHLVMALLDAGADASANKSLALQNALLIENIDLIKILIERGADASSTPAIIQLAVMTEKTKIVELIIKNGAIPSQKAFNHAARLSNNSEAMLRILLDNYEKKKKSLDFKLDIKKPVEIASEYGNLQFVKLLLDSGFKTKSSLALALAINNEHWDIYEELTGRGWELDKWTTRSFIEKAARLGKAGVVRMYLKAGADPKHTSEALRLAASNGEIEIVKILLDAGSDSKDLSPKVIKGLIHDNYWKFDSDTNAKILKILLNAGADISDIESEDLEVMKKRGSKWAELAEKIKILMKTKNN